MKKILLTIAIVLGLILFSAVMCALDGVVVMLLINLLLKAFNVDYTVTFLQCFSVIFVLSWIFGIFKAKFKK